MFNIVYLVIVIAGTAVLAAVYCLFVIKRYPENARKAGYVKAVIVFLLISLSVFMLINLKNFAIIKINEIAVQIDNDVTAKNPNNLLVRNGIDMKQVSEDVARADLFLNELKSMLPDSQEIGIPKTIYDIIVNTLMESVKKRMIVVNHTAKALDRFADENGMLTVSSFINAIKNVIIKIVSIAVLIIIILVSVLFIVYLIITLKFAFKKEQAVAGD